MIYHAILWQGTHPGSGSVSSSPVVLVPDSETLFKPFARPPIHSPGKRVEDQLSMLGLQQTIDG